jgi:hypothetical protein
VGFLDQIGLGQRIADALAGGEQEGVGDAAADDQLIDLVGQRLQDGQLGGNLGAANDGDQRALRVEQRLAQGVDLGAHQHAGAGDRGEFGDAVGGCFGAVGGAEGVIDIDVAQLGHLLRQFVVVLLLALVARQFSSSTTSPGLTSKPPSTQSVIRRTGLCSIGRGARRPAQACRPGSSPSVGRPRCEVTMTAAPFSRQYLIDGSEALMRVSSVMLPASSCGTFRSARMKTRLPETSRSVSLRRSWLSPEDD